jgi:hypothetical protein
LSEEKPSQDDAGADDVLELTCPMDDLFTKQDLHDPAGSRRAVRGRMRCSKMVEAAAPEPLESADPEPPNATSTRKATKSNGARLNSGYSNQNWHVAGSCIGPSRVHN